MPSTTKLACRLTGTIDGPGLTETHSLSVLLPGQTAPDPAKYGDAPPFSAHTTEQTAPQELAYATDTRTNSGPRIGPPSVDAALQDDTINFDGSLILRTHTSRLRRIPMRRK